MTDIWIIEDNVTYSNIISSAINQSDGCRCEKEFTNVADVLKLLSIGDAPAIILTDINLPGMNGIDGITEIKALNKEVEIIVLTVFDDNDKIFDAICNGANGYLLKNSTPEEIIEAIQIVIDGGSSINAGLARKVFSIFSSIKKTNNSYGLTKRENEILNFLVDGKTAFDIAEITYTSPQTVKTHVRNIYHKVHVNTRAGLVSKALKEGLVPTKREY